MTTPSQSAVDRLDRAVLSFLGHRTDTAQHLEQALAEDAGLVPALCLRGFAYKALGSRAFEPEARANAAAARASLAARGGCPREHGLARALSRWCEGDALGAAAALEDTLRAQPRDALTFKLHHALNFILGRPQVMRMGAERALPHWHGSLPGYGFVLGCHAFTLEETGDLEAAERVGRKAVELEPGDAWGAHAVAHVLESQDRAREGLAFMDAIEPGLQNCNNFGGHLAWHRSLFCLQLGDYDAALALHDQRIAPHLGRDYRDTCNASTLLWRLSNEGVDVGRRWQRLAELARARLGDHGLAFADVHYALSLAAAGDIPTARHFVRSMQAAAATRNDYASGVAAAVGVPLASGIVALYAGRARAALEHIVPVAGELSRLGGSQAQRDVFALLLIDTALRAGDTALASQLLERRLGVRPANRFARSRLRALTTTRRAHATPELPASALA